MTPGYGFAYFRAQAVWHHSTRTRVITFVPNIFFALGGIPYRKEDVGPGHIRFGVYLQDLEGEVSMLWRSY